MSFGDRLLIGFICGIVVTVTSALVLEGAPTDVRAHAGVPGGGPPSGGAESGVSNEQMHALLEQINAELGDGAWRSGLEQALEAVDAAHATGDVLLEAEALQVLGNALFFLDRNREALAVFEQALILAEGKGDQHLEALLLKDVGIIEKLLGRYDRALLHLQLAIEREPDWRDDPVTVSILGNLGSLYQQLGAHQLALTTYSDGLEVARRIGDVEGEVDGLERIGALYLGLNRAERALDFIEPALDLEVVLDSDGDVHSRGWLLGMAIDAYWETGRREAAIARSSEALAMWRETGNRTQESEVLELRGWLTIEDDLDGAESFFASSRTIGPEHSSGALAGLAEIALRRGETTEAIELLSSAVDQLEVQRDSMTSAHQRVVFTDHNLGVYHRLIEALLERRRTAGGSDDANRAFQVLEQARTRVLSEALAENHLEPGQWLPPELAAREATIQRRLRSLVERLSETNIASGERAELLLELEKVELETDAVAAALQRSHPHWASLHSPVPLTVHGTQELLDERTALLSYLVTANRVFVFVVTKAGLAVEELPTTADDLAARMSNAHDLMMRSPADGWTTAGAKLTRELVEPLRLHLGSEIEALIVVPDGPLHSLPFEALPRTSDGSRTDSALRYLLEDYEISYAPSATVLAELRRLESQRDRKGPVDALVFANPGVTFESTDAETPATTAERFWRLYEHDGFDLGPLPYGSTEAAMIADVTGADSSILVGREATETSIKAQALDRFEILHFATHGLVTPAAPARSALVLWPGEPGEDGFLQAREIAQLRIEAGLVVLSACRTARGRHSPSEGVQSLARAFITAGASSVLSSVWDVDDAETAEFMAGFYANLGRGMSKASALRAAKLEALKDDRRRAPSNWASFILIGEAGGVVPLEPLPHRRFAMSWVIAVALTAGVMMVSAFISRSSR